MSAALLLWWLGLLFGPAELLAALERADALAQKARAAVEKDQSAAVAAALRAYEELIARRPKDRKWVPKLRRKRASLLKHAGRVREALLEYDAILEGPASRYERARALRDGAKLLRAGGDFRTAVDRLRRVSGEYADLDSLAAESLLLEARCHRDMVRPAPAERALRRLLRRYRSEAKHAIAAYDGLALLAIERGDAKVARRWLQRCADQYAKRAARGDRYGAFLSRLLGEMKAPGRLATVRAKTGTERNR